jgi:putative chitinase
MQLTPVQLQSIAPEALRPRALNGAISHMGAPEAAGFVSTLLGESDLFRRLEEDLCYSAAGLMVTWPKRYTWDLATAHARKPELIAAHVYDGRMGNTLPGDGYRYRGRGYIQITGRDNYTAIGRALDIDLVAHPEKLLDPPIAMAASLAYWDAHKLGALCPWRDKPSQPWRELCRAVNGGYNGLERRVQYADALMAMWGAA